MTSQPPPTPDVTRLSISLICLQHSTPSNMRFCLPDLKKTNTYGFIGLTIKWPRTYLENRAFKDPCCDRYYLRHTRHNLCTSWKSTTVSRTCTQTTTKFAYIAVTTAASRIENCVKEVSGWMDSNRLKLNPSMTELIWFSTRQGFNKFTKATVGVGSTFISPVNHVKSLGATLDDQLKLSKHVSNVTRSCFYQIRQLKNIRRYLVI